MTALTAGPYWRVHDEEVQSVRCKWPLIGNDAEVERVKDVRFVTLEDAFSSRGSIINPAFPSSVLRNWFGKKAVKMEGNPLLLFGFDRDKRRMELHFGTYLSVYITIDPSYDINMQEDDSFVDIETMILPFDKTTMTPKRGQRIFVGHFFKIPRLLVRDFAFSMMRMGGPDLHCDKDDLMKAVEEFLQK